MDGLLERVIADHRQRRLAGAATGEEGDFVDVMLDAEELDTGSIKGIILDMLAAATDSTFTPERFLGYDLKMGQDFAFLPFGAGRRGCPGVGFAMMPNELALAGLVCNFDWELPGGRMPPVDMTELHGLSVRLKAPLLLVAKPWPPVSAVDAVE